MTPSECVITNIKGLMGENGVSQAELGRWLGISQASVAKRLSSRTVVLGVDELEIVAKRFGVPIQSLFDPPRTPVPFQGRVDAEEVPPVGLEPTTYGLQVCTFLNLAPSRAEIDEMLAAAEAHANGQAVWS